MRALLCNSPLKKWRCGIASSLALLAVTGTLLATDAPPRELDGVGIEEHVGATLPLDLTFRNEAGELVPLRSFFDGTHPVILSLAYYECPMLCGMLQNGLMAGFKQLAWSAGKDYQYVNVSINPRESPDLANTKKTNLLATSGQRPATASGWHFLVGEETHIRALTDRIGFKYRYDDEQKQYAHTAAAFVLTPDGRLARYLYGIEFRPRDLRLALLEATDGKLGNTIDRLLLYCYHYDPKTRRYALMATRLMRVGGGITVVGLTLLLLRLRRRPATKGTPC